MHKVSVVGCKSYKQKQVDEAVKKAIEKISFKVRPNSTVLLKPNGLLPVKPEKAVTTHPAVLEALCKILKAKNCKIIIAESFGITIKGSEEVFELTGWKKVAEKHGAEIICFSKDKLKKVKNNKAEFGKEMFMPEMLDKVDLIINLPKFKTHTLMTFTGAVKNLFGCIPGARKQAYHAETKNKKNFADLLLDIWMNIRPELTIMDGIIGMEGDGPSNGDPVNLGIVMASDNAIAMDIVSEEMIGFDGKILTNKRALERQLIDKSQIKAFGKRKLDFRKPSTITVPNRLASFALKHTMAYPKVIKKKCKKCWTCVAVCPVNAMKKKSYPVCDRKKCIACYCCQEMCPYHAIELKKSFFFSLLFKAYMKVKTIMKFFRKGTKAHKRT